MLFDRIVPQRSLRGKYPHILPRPARIDKVDQVDKYVRECLDGSELSAVCI